MNSINHHLFWWAIGSTLTFPLLAIFLGELIDRLQRREQPIAVTLQILRNIVLPVTIFLLYIKYIVNLPSSNNLFKIVETLFWICIIHVTISLFNVIFFSRAKADSWRGKMPKLLIDLSRLLLISIGTAMVLARVWGADLAGLAAALGVSSIAIGLALQDTLGSAISGMALLFERPFAVGDWLQVGDLVGQVIDVNWRAVRLQTLEKQMVVIPHKLISGEIIRNFSQPKRLHAERIQIGFSYKDPPNLAKQVLLITALETQGILTHPQPEIYTLSYNDFAITYEVKFFIQDYENLEEIRDRFMTRVWYAAQRNDLNIPFPTHTLYHFHGPTAVGKNNQKKFIEGLRSIPDFVSLDREENSHNSSQEIILQHFGAGEKVIRQNFVSNCLFIIISGKAAMSVTDDKGEEIEALSLTTGEFFGEMSLFSGQPSMVSVTASEDLEVMLLSINAVNRTIERQPNFLREISQILEIRRRQIEIVLTKR
jgi:small-conductance mechanosensitive channel